IGCCRRAALQRAAELGGRAAVDALECGAEMAVAGEAKIEAECAQVLVCSEQVQCARQPEMQLVAIERETLHLLECLRQIDGRADRSAAAARETQDPHRP